ncbi:uncharacterized protein LOC108913405 [Anoplophora glabripennis]|uniref:uncharacterized protein LOC108913405 n=1 Tax=Anoplophora glabripennis TaxID=217634 RepID=UPI00087559F9|nr:uncharacterized protein LOC108913405 [Anoplophora glabripennis]
MPIRWVVFEEYHILQWCGKKDIITDASLEAVRELVTALRSNVQLIGHGWVFRVGVAVHQGVVQEILTAIQKGQTRTIRTMLEAGWRLESAQALYLFLSNLQKPLVPDSIQALVLDNNENIPVEVVATDVLGLIKQELPQKHLHLITILLNLLDTVIKFSPADELRGNTLPISMLPLFFNIQTRHMQEWRRIVTIFVELIRKASQQLEIPSNRENVRLNENNFLLELNQIVEESIELRENTVVRRYLIPVGYRGDC